MTSFGIDRLLADPELRRPLEGKRVALLAHPASVTADLTHSLDALSAAGVKLTAAFGSPPDLKALSEASDETLRESGLSRQKAGYARSLAALVMSGELDLSHLPEDDEEAIALLTKVKGIGRKGLLDPETNIAVGTRVLAEYVERDNGRLDTALIRYSGKAGAYPAKVQTVWANLEQVRSDADASA